MTSTRFTLECESALERLSNHTIYATKVVQLSDSGQWLVRQSLTIGYGLFSSRLGWLVITFKVHRRTRTNNVSYVFSILHSHLWKRKPRRRKSSCFNSSRVQDSVLGTAFQTCEGFLFSDFHLSPSFSIQWQLIREIFRIRPWNKDADRSKRQIVT